MNAPVDGKLLNDYNRTMPDAGDLVLEAGPLEGVPGAALLRVSGKGGRSVVKRLQDAIQPLLAAGTAKLLFDCARLEFLNSTALGYLINLADQARAAGGALAFCRVPKKAQAAFDLLGLREFFRFFPDEAKAAAYLGEGIAPPAPPPPPPPPPAPPPEAEAPEGPKPRLLAAFPAWLEEVDQPAAPSLEHPRWTVLLQTVADRMGTAGLAAICGRLNVPTGGHLAQVIRRVLRHLRTPQDLLGHFDEKTLARIGRLYDLPARGGKDRLIEAIVDFVRRSSTESMSEVLREQLEIAPIDFAMLPVELTGDNLLRTLENCPFPKLLKSGRAARDLLSRRMAKVFGPEKVACGKAVGRRVAAKVDIEVAGTFGIVVRLAGRLLGGKGAAAREVPGLLGQIVLLAGRYGKGNLFAVLAGELPSEHAAALDEVRTLAEGAGARFVRLR